MPRISGVYTQPFDDVITETTISSSVYNGTINDIETDLNTPRPVVAGGTGATSAAAARTNLQTEVRNAQVTNYNSHVWEPGSFWSASNATSAPSAAEHMVGSVKLLNSDQNNLVIEARGVTTGAIYYRIKAAGVWGAWVLEGLTQAAADTRYVNVAGDTMSGGLAAPSYTLTTGGYLNSDANALNIVAPGGTGLMSVGSAASPNNNYRNTNQYFTLANGSYGTTVDVRGKINVASNASYPFNSTGCPLKVAYAGAGAEFGIGVRSAQSTGWAMEFSVASGAVVGSITVDASATAFNTSSDERLKTDLKTFDAANIIESTDVYDFAWKSTGARSYGILAQQAKDVYPAAVTHREVDDWWGIDYAKYIPVVIQELKSLRLRVAELEAALIGKLKT